ncbi:MAG: DNA recombination protein RmuC [Bacteriovoracia bacterium]
MVLGSLIVLFLSVLIVLQLKSGSYGKKFLNSISEKISYDLTQQILKTNGDLSLGIAKNNADLRQEISDRINDRFVIIGKELRDSLQSTTLALENKFSALDSKINMRLETIGKDVQTKLDKNIQEGFSHFQKVQETLIGAEKQLSELSQVGQSIHQLNQVLNLPHLRGKILGEGTLERLLADFLPADFYALQYSIDGAQVDAVIRYNHLNLVLPIDSKFNMEQVSALFEETSSPESLKAARKRLAEVVKQNAKDIAKKYIKPKLGTTDWALMYLPSEILYFEVVRDTDLWNSLVSIKVFPISPNTLAITVNSMAKSLEYYEMAKGVRKTIQQLQTAREHFDHFKNRFDDIGEKLTKAQESFNKATTHFSHYSSSVGKLTQHEGLQENLLPPS